MQSKCSMLLNFSLNSFISTFSFYCIDMMIGMFLKWKNNKNHWWNVYIICSFSILLPFSIHFFLCWPCHHFHCFFFGFSLHFSVHFYFRWLWNSVTEYAIHTLRNSIRRNVFLLLQFFPFDTNRMERKRKTGKKCKRTGCYFN